VGAVLPDVPAGALMGKRADADLSPLAQRIGVNFADPELLRQALTHVSACVRRGDSYQRLEFLGDRVLGLAIADMLYKAFPEAAEGELSRRLADLVRRETCAEVALEWGVAPYIILGGGEAQSGGAQKTAILGDICESVLGAVFLDAGFDAAVRLVQASFASRLEHAGASQRDPKSALQEWAQGRGLTAPIYRIEGQTGPDHAPHFIVSTNIEGFAAARGEGNSKRHAEQAAAEAFLAREKIVGTA
ncbi:MAG: ribonuclease III, partial [Rhodoblastus sp.]